MSDWNEDKLHHKYDPLPDEPRHRKKAKKRHVRSDHRHVYEDVCIDGHMKIFSHGETRPWYYVAKRCKSCGKLKRVRRGIYDVPDGMPLYEVNGLEGLWVKELGEELRVK